MSRSPRETQIIDGVVCYQCTACFGWFPRGTFYRDNNPRSRCGISSKCKCCTDARNNENRNIRIVRELCITN